MKKALTWFLILMFIPLVIAYVMLKGALEALDQ